MSHHQGGLEEPTGLGAWFSSRKASGCSLELLGAEARKAGNDQAQGRILSPSAHWVPLSPQVLGKVRMLKNTVFSSERTQEPGITPRKW